MRSVRSLLLTVAIVVAALVPSTALASRGIMFSHTVISVSGRVTINGNVICDNSFTISLTSNPLLKTTGTNQGTVAGNIERCTGGGATGPGTVLAGSTIRYESFSGTLPAITSIGISSQNWGFQMTTIVGNCLYGGNLSGLVAQAPSLRVTTLNFNSSTTLNRASGSALCPTTVTLRGALSIIGTPPTITLV